MKKLILKTALITLGGAVVLGAILVAVLCFAAPRAMMDLTASLGMDGVSGNFAYAEYERSGDLDCLARSFLIAESDDDEEALRRFEALYADEGFSAYCENGAPAEGVLPDYSYRDYLTGTAARVKYRLADTAEKKTAALAFAISETAQSFPQGNPVIALAAEATSKDDSAFLGEIATALASSDLSHSEAFLRLTEQLEGIHA